MSDSDERYARQIRLAELGAQGQQKLRDSSVLLVGCGALGSNMASALVRLGVGRIRIVDRDILELGNLPRQVLFDEDDVAAGLPKVEAAVRKLRRINSAAQIDGQVLDVTGKNVEELMTDVSLVLDGTDNLETRYLINDACIKRGLPWIYGGVIGTTGMSLVVLPGDGPCLRCIFPTPPPPGSLPTCETHGVLGTAPAIVASLQVTEAVKLLSGAEPSRALISLDIWNRTFEQVVIHRDPECPCCEKRQFDFLDTRETAWVTSLCGRNSIQISPAQEMARSLEQLSQDLSGVAEVTFNGLLLQITVEGHEIVLFPDGRAIIKGTTDEAVARSIYTRYVGM